MGQTPGLYSDVAQQEAENESRPTIDENYGYFVDRIQVDNEIIPESEPAVNVNRSVSDIQPLADTVNDRTSYDTNAAYNSHILVWISDDGGKYHNNSTCSGMKNNVRQVTIEDAAQAEKMVTVWMGDNIDARKEYIAEHANFDRSDKFAEEYSSI